jgi:hypothetical protein
MPVPQVSGVELGELIARGGTSEVWAGVALADGHRVAVKVVHAELCSLEAASREASVSARAASAHVVAVEACVDLPDGRVALVMPHLRGGSLDDLVRARGHLTPGEVVTVLAPVASAIGRLHDLGVVHGDVSPGNVLLDLDGRAALGDLGLGHVVGDISPGVWGTDGYLAPEVVLGEDPSPASDVYGLGALGWLCLTGQVPGASGLRPALAEVCLAGEGSDPVVRAVDAALAPEPGDRPGAHELAWALFRAATPVPLDLVRADTDGDEVRAVTYRLRAAAGVVPEPAAGRGRALLHRVLPDGVRWRTRPEAEGVPRRRGRHARPGGRTRRTVGSVGTVGSEGAAGSVAPGGPGRPWVRPLVGGVLTVLVLLAVLVVTVAAVGQGRSRSGAAGGPAAVVAAEPSVTGTPAGARTAAGGIEVLAAAGTDARADPEAPRGRPAVLLEELAEARAVAWREAAPALLHTVDAPRSPASVRDAAAVAELARAGLRYTGLRYAVAEVETVSATPERAVLRARIDTAPYAVTGPTGSMARPAVRGSAVLVHLSWTDAGWRVADLRPDG